MISIGVASLDILLSRSARSLLQSLAAIIAASERVARQARLGVIRELSTTETASYSLMIARIVGVSDSEPFQSAAIRGYRGSRKTLNTIQEQNKLQNGETRMACET
eukprot:2774163-Pleurochrysis_carterae.AAC.4